MPRTKLRSISFPIVLSSVTVALTIPLLVGWTFFTVQNLERTREVAQNTWLLVAGVVSFAIIMTVVVMFSVFLVREILEVRRQYTFIDSVTHELKSPLASLRLCLETQRRPELKEEQKEELRGMMLEDVDRLTSFIEDILESSRITHGRRELLLSEVRFGAVVQRCVDGIVKRYRVPPGAILVDIPDVTLSTDETALETVLRNLLDNAVKYSSQPMQVQLRAKVESGAMLVIEVRDHGIGIPRQHLKRVFDRFYRVPGEAVHARMGTGLGLYVVASLVRNMGGRIDARSDGPGKGTTIRLMVPMITSEDRNE